MPETIGYTLIAAVLVLTAVGLPVLSTYRWMPIEKAMRIHWWYRFVANLVIFALFGFVVYYVVLPAPTLGLILLFGFLGWCMLPIKHPCDYRNYNSWWADRRNWLK